MSSRKEINKRYREKNKEKIKERQKEYDQKNKERKKEYYEKNKERTKEYYEKNKEKINQRHKEYRENNKEKIKEHQKEYDQSPAGKKSSRIGNWKFNGVIHDDFNELYEKYINTEFCELCNCKLTVDRQNTKTTRCLDHDHTTGEFRNIVCHSCNVKRG